MTCFWLGRQDSNLRMAEPKSAALPLGYGPITLLILPHFRTRVNLTQKEEALARSQELPRDKGGQ